MYQDFKDLLSAFHAHSVNYLIIGGYAVALHAQPRATKDLDVISRDDLIASKLASGRTRDLADVEEIREAADSQPPEPR
jgi:hypothetical protein